VQLINGDGKSVLSFWLVARCRSELLGVSRQENGPVDGSRTVWRHGSSGYHFVQAHSRDCYTVRDIVSLYRGRQVI